MSEVQVQDTLVNPDSTVTELLDAHEELSIKFGCIAFAQTYGLQQNVESDLLKILSLLDVLKERIKVICQAI